MLFKGGEVFLGALILKLRILTSESSLEWGIMKAKNWLSDLKVFLVKILYFVDKKRTRKVSKGTYC